MADRVSPKRLVAEFLAIAAGVSLGLLADDYRQSRDDRRAETEYLQLLARDLESDLGRLMFTRDGLRATAAAGTTVRGAAIGTPYPTDSLQVAGAMLSFSISYDAQRATFETMKSGGELRLIRDPLLRSDLTDYHEVSQARIRSYLADYKVAYVRFRATLIRHFELYPPPDHVDPWPLPDGMDFARPLTTPEEWYSDLEFWSELGEVVARCGQLLEEIDAVIEENRSLRQRLLSGGG